MIRGGLNNRWMESWFFLRPKRRLIRICFVKESLIAFTAKGWMREQFISVTFNIRCRLRRPLIKGELRWVLSLRGNKLKPLVAEFATYHTAFCDPQQQPTPTHLNSVLKGLPKGARVTHRRQLISGDVFRGDAVMKASNSQSSGGALATTVGAGVEACESVEVCNIGVPGLNPIWMH